MGDATSVEPVLPHQTFTLQSRVLGETRRINVYTPPDYAQATDERYPVLYLPDGGLAEDFPHVIRTVDEGIRVGELRPLIVIGIENTERRRDMSGPTEVESDRRIAPRVGGSVNFRAFIRDELMPEVRERVRGSAETGIMGESLAGLFVIETFLLEPALFDHYIAMSPSLWWNEQRLLRSAPERLRALPARPTSFFLTVAGDDEIDNAVATLAENLRQANLPWLKWSFEPMPGEHHSTIYRAAAPAALRKTFPPPGADRARK
ncbi:MAG: alpha/beta hydrolase-fold protein [Planctomycetota bacterium]